MSVHSFDVSDFSEFVVVVIVVERINSSDARSWAAVRSVNDSLIDSFILSRYLTDITELVMSGLVIHVAELMRLIGLVTVRFTECAD